MQAIWKGAISFGMVTIPIKVFSATEEKDISFRQVHVADGGRIRYKRVCAECGEEVPYSDIGKGYEMADGRMVVLEPDDFADLPLSSKKVIDVLEFVPADQVDPLYLGKSYYLAADGGPGAKPYVLLRDALEGSELYALVKVALRSRESLGLLRTHDNVLVLQVMLWPDEVRDSSFAAPVRGRGDPQAGEGDGRVVHRHPARRVRPGPVPRRVPRTRSSRWSRPRPPAYRFRRPRKRRPRAPRSSTWSPRSAPRSRQPRPVVPVAARAVAARATRTGGQGRQPRRLRRRAKKAPAKKAAAKKAAGQEDGCQEGREEVRLTTPVPRSRLSSGGLPCPTDGGGSMSDCA